MKDVSIRITGDGRKDLKDIQDVWPVAQTIIVEAALHAFAALPVEEQGIRIRSTHSENDESKELDPDNARLGTHETASGAA